LFIWPDARQKPPPALPVKRVSGADFTLPLPTAMPIYAYKCESCGHAKDVLQKISDAPLTECPACGAATFSKQLTAAGFQLKGSGWYATDFKGGAGGAAATTAAASTDAATATESKPAESASAAPAATPCGGSCACH
jgi:putative FmdB family regulatory protein